VRDYYRPDVLPIAQPTASKHSLSLSILTAIFPSEPGLAGFTGAQDDGGGGDNWSYKMCKVPVKLSSPTNQYQTFYRPDGLSVAQPKASKH